MRLPNATSSARKAVRGVPPGLRGEYANAPWQHPAHRLATTTVVCDGTHAALVAKVEGRCPLGRIGVLAAKPRRIPVLGLSRNRGRGPCH